MLLFYDFFPWSGTMFIASMEETNLFSLHLRVHRGKNTQDVIFESTVSFHCHFEDHKTIVENSEML